MAKYQNYLIDLDGTTYRGRQPIPAAQCFIHRLQAQQLPFAFLNNNTTKTPQAVVQNLAQNHNIKVQPEQVITPSAATADFLLEQAGTHLKDQSLYVIGEQGLKTPLYQTGLQFNETDPNYVVVGLDSDVTYHKFELATLAILRGAQFIGTNADTNLPNERGLVPGAGSVISLVETATQRRAIYIGKPERRIADYALKTLRWSRDQVLLIGDNYQTDIKCGLAAGIDTLLVYTGVSTPQQVQQQKELPTYQVASLDDWEL